MVGVTQCMICGSNDIHRKFSIPAKPSPGRPPMQDKFDVLACTMCLAEFASPRPDMGELERYYDTGETDVERYVDRYRVLFPRLDYGGFREARFLLRTVTRLVPPPGRLLDVACGQGWHMATARDLGYQVRGMDVSAAALAVCHDVLGFPAGDVVHGLFEEYEVNERNAGQYDVIIMSQILEHVLEPLMWIEKAVALLRNGGVLVVAVPNHRSLEIKFLGRRYGFYCPPEHLNFFSPETLRHIAERFPLRLETIATRSLYSLEFLRESRWGRLLVFSVNLLVDKLMPGSAGRFVYAYFTRTPA